MEIYVGNLAYATTDEGLRAAFAAYGEVTAVRVVTDRMTGRSKGFGFVTMPDATQAQAAIDALNGHELDGRTVRVNESQPKPREERGGYGRDRGGYGRDRGGYGRDRGPRRETRW
ncbi:MAG: RNA-binding protein [Kiritimatiellae bacterium]|nr:RNA-binding protein [Kiritimatiellia bacterium]MBR4603515.1 RNA-binding protein [Kiritimatiellia bacterium]